MASIFSTVKMEKGMRLYQRKLSVTWTLEQCMGQVCVSCTLQSLKKKKKKCNKYLVTIFIMISFLISFSSSVFFIAEIRQYIKGELKSY